MTIRRVLILGNHTPRQCGIATFTADLADALLAAQPALDVRVAAMNDGQAYEYPGRVVLSIDQHDHPDYLRAAAAINAMNVDVVCVQHEFGIFGGPAGSYLLGLLRALEAPVVTTLHTVLEEYSPEQRAVVEELTVLSERLVVMSERAVSFLTAQGVPAGKIEFIHHGVPLLIHDRDEEKARLGLQGRQVILTFGLLSPNKGLETAIRALPAVVRDHPDLTYLILGATHPHLRAREGEAYREGLMALAESLGVSGNVRFENRFASLEELGRFIAAADIYLTPYLNREQITSGTLAYALGNGKAVVSTPYWHAEELLAQGRGELVPFRDEAALGAVLCRLLGDPAGRAALEARALEYGRHMSWPSIGAQYLDVFGETARAVTLTLPAPALPSVTLRHVAALSDDTGVFQHATFTLPNPHEGYTTDDNARALMLAAACPDEPHAPLLARRALTFLHHALDADGFFRNFMSYDRRWLEARGSENAQARAVRALVIAAEGLTDAGLRGAARELLGHAWPALHGLESPRAQAIALIALAAHREHGGPHADLDALAHAYAANLRRLHAAHASPEWPWFEPYLSYSNAKLPHGLIAYGRAYGRPADVALGLEALSWLETVQTGPHGTFWPVGSERVYRAGEARPLWDGQPIEVHATVAADLEAFYATGNEHWLELARRAVDWLLGSNPLRQPLYDAASGGCRDGLHRERLNMNEGAESTLALWQSVADLNAAQSAPSARTLTGD
ncbi:glycosyltransferase family 4 protein [Deinococcus koreensis]|uniref:Glycosyl transferase family 1 n=1 Tax=Deinococcus koreensis TaxID=2054903 RepID=A0A2K3UT92_9DEIO|nr:glycosyltransferase family 4 protein [Deinococcus koreensis]PNY79764.1 glycosyl transferase family 1 [Deinococcus koreensis]